MFIPGKLYQITIPFYTLWKNDKLLDFPSQAHLVKRNAILLCLEAKKMNSENIGDYIIINFLYDKEIYYRVYAIKAKDLTLNWKYGITEIL